MSGELAGALDQRVTILKRAGDRDDLGGASGPWEERATVWAAIAPMRDGPWGAGDRSSAAARWRAVLRAGAAVAVGDRLRWRGAMFAVREAPADPATPDRISLTLEEVR